jgi:hypothetical protein
MGIGSFIANPYLFVGFIDYRPTVGKVKWAMDSYA